MLAAFIVWVIERMLKVMSFCRNVWLSVRSSAEMSLRRFRAASAARWRDMRKPKIILCRDMAAQFPLDLSLYPPMCMCRVWFLGMPEMYDPNKWDAHSCKASEKFPQQEESFSRRQCGVCWVSHVRLGRLGDKQTLSASSFYKFVHQERRGYVQSEF